LQHQKRIYQVEVDGNVHRTSQEWLIGGTFSLNRWDELAHNYWKGTNYESIEDEVLFTGRIKILKVVNFSNIL
jgi:hypothetical protein